VVLLISCVVLTGCAASLGPGYRVEQQEIDVHFSPASDSAQPPRIQVQATYHLRNVGNRPLKLIEVRLPGSRRLHVESLQAFWDGTNTPIAPSLETLRNSVVNLPSAWTVSDRHTLSFSYEIVSAQADDSGLRFTNDAFFLPSASWTPELPQPQGLFGFGGIPPQKWNLTVRVPSGFLVHTSGQPRKKSNQAAEQVVRAVQTSSDHYPFVVAGRYVSAQVGSAQQPAFLWTRSASDAAFLKEASQQLTRTTAAYDSILGKRTRQPGTPIWIVECPGAQGCFTAPIAPSAALLAEGGSERLAEMASLDTVMVDFTKGSSQLAAAVGPSLAASWLGYGQNPGYYDQVPPLSVLPAFAAAAQRESLEGPAYRSEVIRRALSRVPHSPPRNTRDKSAVEDPVVLRAKSFLFFFALQDRFGRETFHKAISHMLEARRSRGFDISDLIASFDQESRQYDAAAFVRLWMKHPGVPDEFRARYESTDNASATADGKKETLQ
jgi:hypothetical protein